MKEPKTENKRSAGAQKEVSGTSKQNTDADKQPNVPKKRDPLIVPEIPGSMKKLLNDKDRPVKELKAINVKFFPNNIHEVEYIVLLEGEDGLPQETTLSVTQFMKLQEQKSQFRKAEHEKQTFDGLAHKYYRRLYITLPDEIDVPEGRRITAVKAPSVVKKMLGFTQKEFAENFPTPEHVVVFWEKSPETAIKAMNDYQRVLRPGVTWSDTLVAARREITEQKEARALKELERSKRKAALVETDKGPDGSSNKIEALATQSRDTRLFATGPKIDVASPSDASWARQEEDDTAGKRLSAAFQLIGALKDPLKNKVPIALLADLSLFQDKDHFEWFMYQINEVKLGHDPTWTYEELTEDQKKLLHTL